MARGALVVIALAVSAPTALGVRAPVRGVRAPAVRMMFSDSRPTIEYMEYLRDGDKFSDLTDCAALIVGAGKLGKALHGAMGFEGDVLLGRGEAIPADWEGPVFVCVPHAELASVLDACPESKYDDLVFWQQPYIEPLLKRYAMTENTQVNAYFYINPGRKPVDVTTDLQPEGLTTVTGKWAVAVTQRLARAELSCKLLNKRDFRRAAIERHIGVCALHAIGSTQAHMGGRAGMTFGEVERFAWGELEVMVKQVRADGLGVGCVMSREAPARVAGSLGWGRLRRDALGGEGGRGCWRARGRGSMCGDESRTRTSLPPDAASERARIRARCRTRGPRATIAYGGLHPLAPRCPPLTPLARRAAAPSPTDTPPRSAARVCEPHAAERRAAERAGGPVGLVRARALVDPVRDRALQVAQRLLVRLLAARAQEQV
jgi:hypothetical protein